MTLAELLTLLIIGLVAGWLAGAVMRGGGYGLLANLLLGIVGAILGGFLFGLLGIAAYGFLGRVVVAFFGAIVVIGIARLVGGRPAASRG
jgi:uncharacterized membrane protein YeaQ/YmgE (transglycosylase-associated protein family)